MVAQFDGDAEALFAVLDEIEERIAALDDEEAEPTIDLDTAPFDEKYDTVETELNDLDLQHADPSVGLSDSDFEAKLDEVEASLEALDLEHADPSVGLDLEDLEAKAAEAEAIVAELDAQQITLDAEPAAASVDDLTGSLADADIASTDLMGSLGALGPVVETTAAEIDDLSGSADEASASLTAMGAAADGAAGDTAIAGLSEATDTLVGDLGEIPLAAAPVEGSFEDLQMSVLDVIDIMEDAGFEFDSLAELSAILGLSLDDATVSEDAFRSAMQAAKTEAGLYIGVGNQWREGIDDVGFAYVDLEEDMSGVASAGAVLDGVMQDLNENVIDLGTAIADLEESGLDAETGFQLLEGAGNDVAETIFDSQRAVSGLEDALDALEQTMITSEEFAQDLANGINDVELAVEDAENAGGGFTEFLSAAGAGAQEAAGMFSLMGLALVGGVLAAIPAVGALVGEIGALSAIAFTAFAGLGAAVIGLIPDFGEVEAAVKFFAGLYEEALKPFDATVVPPLLKIIQQAFTDLYPIAVSADEALTEIFTTIGQQMQTPAFVFFIQWVAENAGPALVVLANFATSIVETLAEMGEAGQPFINMIESGISSLGSDLQKFGNSNTFKDFVNWLVQNGPNIGEDFEQIGRDVGDLVTAFAPFGEKVLNSFTHFMNGITPMLEVLGSLLANPGQLITQLEEQWDGAWAAMQAGFEAAWGYISSTAPQIGSDLENWIMVPINAVKSGWDTAWGGIKSGFDTSWNAIKSEASAIVGDLNTWIMAPINAAEAAWNAAWGGMKSGFDSAWGAISSTFGAVGSAIHTAVVAPIQLAEAAWDYAWGGFQEAVSSVWNVIKGIFSDIEQGIGAVVGAAGKLGGVISDIGNVASAIGKFASGGYSIGPIHFAEGGLVDGPTHALIGEGGEREFVIPESKFPGGFGSAKTPEDLLALPSLGPVSGGGGGGGPGGGDYYHVGDLNVHSPSSDPAQVAKEVVNQMLIAQRSKGVRGNFAQSGNRR